MSHNRESIANDSSVLPYTIIVCIIYVCVCVFMCIYLSVVLSLKCILLGAIPSIVCTHIFILIVNSSIIIKFVIRMKVYNVSSHLLFETS